jgi:hypothetical protein
MKEKLKYPVLILVLSLSLCAAAIILHGCNSSAFNENESSSETEITTTKPPEILNPLTGLPGYSADLLENRPVMIMINNIKACRPQWGLTTPDIVFETVTEGGITRMLWMYADKSLIPEKVGSVRSARHYYIQIARGFDAIFVHWGGSTYAYNEIRKGIIDNIDGMSSGKYFDRDYSRGASIEHTGFTTGSKIISAVSDKNYRTQIKEDYKNPFKFAKEKRSLAGGVCQTINFSFSNNFSYSYKYNALDGLYYSYLNGDAFVDSKDNQQSFTTAVIIYANISSLNDAKARVTLDFSGGKGVYVTNGTYENITWKKGDDLSKLSFYSADGAELLLNPGRSYIGIVPTDKESLTTLS